MKNLEKKPETYEDKQGSFFVLLGGYFYPLEQVGRDKTAISYKLVYGDNGNIGFLEGDQFIGLKPARKIDGGNDSTIKAAYIGCIGTIIAAFISVVAGAIITLALPQQTVTTICSNINAILSNGSFCNFGSVVETILVTPTPQYTQKYIVDVPARFDASNNFFPATFLCNVSGRYRITVEDGAYSGWPDGIVTEGYGVPPGGQWRTFILIYVNKDYDEIWRRTEFGSPRLLEQPVLFDKDTHSVGLLEDRVNSSQNQAISDGKGQMTLVNCNQGQVMGFIPFDERGQYFDNIGSVTLSIEWNQ